MLQRNWIASLEKAKDRNDAVCPLDGRNSFSHKGVESDAFGKRVNLRFGVSPVDHRPVEGSRESVRRARGMRRLLVHVVETEKVEVRATKGQKE
jgi:hypothetical protein